MILNNIVSKFVAKLLKYRILFMNILTFLGLDYRYQYTKNQIIQKFVVKKVKNQYVSNGLMDFLVNIIELLRFLNCTKLL